MKDIEMCSVCKNDFDKLEMYVIYGDEFFGLWVCEQCLHDEWGDGICPECKHESKEIIKECPKCEYEFYNDLEQPKRKTAK